MKKKTSLAQFMPFVRRYYVLFICIMLCACAVGAVDIAAPYLIGKAIDEMASAGAVKFPAIFRILWILVLCYTGHAIFKSSSARMLSGSNRLPRCGTDAAEGF